MHVCTLYHGFFTTEHHRSSSGDDVALSAPVCLTRIRDSSMSDKNKTKQDVWIWNAYQLCDVSTDRRRSAFQSNPRHSNTRSRLRENCGRHGDTGSSGIRRSLFKTIKNVSFHAFDVITICLRNSRVSRLVPVQPSLQRHVYPTRCCRNSHTGPCDTDCSHTDPPLNIIWAGHVSWRAHKGIHAAAPWSYAPLRATNILARNLMPRALWRFLEVEASSTI